MEESESHHDLAISTFDRVAKGYQDLFMELDLYNATYDRFCAMVAKPGAHIFEVGCGPGNIPRYLLAKRPDFQLHATDAAPNMVALAKQNLPQAKVELMDARHLGALSTRYDGVVIGFCMPYLPKDECLQLIADSAAVLQPEGVLYLSVIEDNYDKSGFEWSSDGQHKCYVYCHEESYLKEGMQASGFAGIEAMRIHYTKANGTEATHLVLLGRKTS